MIHKIYIRSESVGRERKKKTNRKNERADMRLRSVGSPKQNHICVKNVYIDFWHGYVDVFG